jgi:hypothetical protein
MNTPEIMKEIEQLIAQGDAEMKAKEPPSSPEEEQLNERILMLVGRSMAPFIHIVVKTPDFLRCVWSLEDIPQCIRIIIFFKIKASGSGLLRYRCIPSAKECRDFDSLKCALAFARQSYLKASGYRPSVTSEYIPDPSYQAVISPELKQYIQKIVRQELAARH